MALSVIAVIAILLILYVDFQSWRLVLVMALMLPLALLGGVAGAMLVGGVISLGSLVGFVTVLGIAARNAIMLVSHYRHLQVEEGMPFGSELILRGAEERLAPDPDDRADHGPGPGAAGPDRQRPGAGNRVPDGVRHSGWHRHLRASESVLPAGGLRHVLVRECTGLDIARGREGRNREVVYVWERTRLL